MKFYKINSLKLASAILLLTSLIFAIFLTGCQKKPKSNLIKCDLDNYSMYPKSLESILPSYTIEKSENRAFYTLKDGAISEAFHTQAYGALETGIAKYWYPQYLATVVIAVDRDQSQTQVTGWEDLLNIKEDVAFSNTSTNNQMFLAAMSYGLEGKDYTLTKAATLLNSLYKTNRLKRDSYDCPILICYDYQAAAMVESGRNMEIIIPWEGTLTYEKGLLSNTDLTFVTNTDKILYENKFMLLNGQADPLIYPDKASYGLATKLEDYDHFAKTTRDASPQIERNVLNSKRLMSIDNREHLYFALIYISIITLWIVSILRRSMQKGVSYAAFFTGIILNGWALVRLIKYQVVVSEVFSRYLWYSYYIFQLSLPLVILWMAWAIDKPKNQTFPPKWWRVLSVLIGLLIILVFTNDFHGYVFKLDLTRPDWSIDYSYGFGYFIILFISMLNIIISLGILIKKGIKSPRKKGVVLPLLTFILFGIYNYKYIMRDPLVYETDITLATGVFTMLMFESCIRSGLIPVNTKYIEIFKGSPLKMQILNNEKKVVLASAYAKPIKKETVDRVLSSSPLPLQENNSLIFANSIPGGYALWSEDISKIQQLHKKISQSTKRLVEANAILAKEEEAKRNKNEKRAKKQLMEQLEAEIRDHIEKLSSKINKLESSDNHLIESTRIGLLLCYIKRRSNLFFKEKKGHNINIEDIILYINELQEIAQYSQFKIAIIKEIKRDLPIRYATLFYDFLYAMVDLALKKECSYIIADFAFEEETFTMKLLPSFEIGKVEKEVKLTKAIKDVGGKISRKEIEDTIGISLSFPQGGVKNA